MNRMYFKQVFPHANAIVPKTQYNELSKIYMQCSEFEKWTFVFSHDVI